MLSHIPRVFASVSAFKSTTLICALALAVSSPPPARAADPSGQFAIKGAGLQTCANFGKSFDARQHDLGIYLGWFEGYVTALNQMQDDLFDLLPWQDSETTLRMLRLSCSTLSEDTQMMRAANKLIQLLAASRLTEESEPVGFGRGAGKIVVYKEVLRRVHQRLAQLGYAVDAEAETLDERTSLEIERFQRDNALPVTGLPDQATLVALFIRTGTDRTETDAD